MSKFKMPARDVQSWVEGDTAPAAAEPSKAASAAPKEGKQARLTIDLPAELHRQFKAACVMKGTSMVDEVRRFIEQQAAQKHS